MMVMRDENSLLHRLGYEKLEEGNKIKANNGMHAFACFSYL
jgi:hypothetical protein